MNTAQIVYSCDSLEGLDALLKEHPDPNMMVGGQRLLVWVKKIPLYEKLLDSGADPNLISARGLTAFECVMRDICILMHLGLMETTQHLEKVIELFVDRGAVGHKALDILIEHSHYDFARILLRHGFEPTIDTFDIVVQRQAGEIATEIAAYFDLKELKIFSNRLDTFTQSYIVPVVEQKKLEQELLVAPSSRVSKL